MFQFIRKHQAIGLIFIGIVIVSFVIFFSPNQGGRMGRVPTGALGSIRGRPIEHDEYLAALKEARLAYMLRNQGQWPGRSGQDWDESREVLTRLFLLDEAKRLGVTVSDEVAASRILDLPFLRDERAGGFNRAAYDSFVAGRLSEGGLTRADFEKFMHHEVALEHLVYLGGMSGALVTPREAEARFRSGNDRFSARLVLFSASNHVANVDLSATNLLRFYSNRVAAYRIPERMQVRYVRFSDTNFFAEADQQLLANTNLATILDAQYSQRGADSFRDASNNVKTPEAAKDDIRQEFRKGLALNAARKKANEFANRVYQMEPSPESISKLAQELGLIAQTSSPFSQGSIPFDLQVDGEFSRKAFALSADEPFATPFIGQDAVLVYAFDKRIPSEVRPFQEVEVSVREAVKRTESRSAAEAEGQKFRDQAITALGQGKAFDAIATEAGLATIVLTNFSADTKTLPELPSRLTVGEVLRTANELQAGKVGAFTASGDGGFVLYLESRESAPDDVVKTALPDFLKQQRQFGRFSSFMEWERKRFAAADVKVPGSSSAGMTNAPNAVP